MSATVASMVSAALSAVAKKDLSGTEAKAQVLITGSIGDAEARCTMEVFRIMVQTKLKVVTSLADDRETALSHLTATDHLAVVLTRGLLQDHSFAEVILTVEQMR